MLDWLKDLTPGGVGIWTLVGMIGVALIRQRPISQKLDNEREGNLLNERARDNRELRKRIAELEAEQRIDRHAIANLEQALDMLLMLIELNPDRAQEAAAKVKQMREQMRLKLATEKGAMFRDKVDGEVEE